MLNRALDLDKPVTDIVTVPGFKNKVIVVYARLSPDKVLRIAYLLRRYGKFYFTICRKP